MLRGYSSTNVPGSHELSIVVSLPSSLTSHGRGHGHSPAAVLDEVPTAALVGGKALALKGLALKAYASSRRG